MEAQDAVERIGTLFAQYGKHTYGEVMTQTQHAVQAARLAATEGYPDHVVLGAFLHDIGHLMINEVPPEQRDDALYRHQRVGADYLRELGFDERVANLVERHVDGKRYLTAVDPSYRDTLSRASIESLAFQGGPMTPDEVDRFEARPDKSLHLALRRWDDQAKDPSDPDTDLKPDLEMAGRHLSPEFALD